MNVRQLLQRVRSRLRDDVGSNADRLWTDEDLIDDYANEARFKLFTRTRRLIVDSSTATDAASLPLCSIPVVAGTASYAISPKILKITHLSLSTQTGPLVMKMADELDATYPNWQNSDAGEPWAYCPDADTDKIVLYPKPIANATASLRVYRLPLTALSITNPNADLDFKEQYHADLIYGIQELAFLKQDAETNSPVLSATYGEKFQARCEEIKRDLLRRTAGGYTNRPRKAFMTK